MRGQPLPAYSISSRASSPHVLWCLGLLPDHYGLSEHLQTLTRACSILQHPAATKTKALDTVKLQLDTKDRNKKISGSLKRWFLRLISECAASGAPKALKWNRICNILSEFPQCLKIKNILSERRHLHLNNAVHGLSWSVKKSQAEKAQSASEPPIWSLKWRRSQQVCVCFTQKQHWADFRHLYNHAICVEFIKSAQNSPCEPNHHLMVAAWI